MWDWQSSVAAPGCPIPARGYWQRTESGQAVEPTPLREAPKGLPEWLRIRGKQPAIPTRGNSSRAGKQTQKNEGWSLIERQRPAQPRSEQ
jgi:hypothetical protein